MNLKNTFFSLLLCFCYSVSFAQKEWSNWYFNGSTLLTFRDSNKAKIEKNFISPQPNKWSSYANSYSQGTAYSDKVTGELKFLVSGSAAYDRNYDMINLNEYLRVCPGDKYSFHIIPFSNNANKFYVVQFEDIYATLLSKESGLQVRCPNALGLSYSILDLSRNNGLGGFTEMNRVVQWDIPERISVIRHANGKDAWVVVHSWGSNEFTAYLFSDNGVSGPVISAIGPYISGTSKNATGNMVASHDGKTIAAQQSVSNFVEFYDFNNSTGTLSNYRTLATGSTANHFIFSADDTKFYLLSNYLNPGLFQYNLKAANIESSAYRVTDDPHTSYGDMQLGPDGKLYLSRYTYLDTNYNSYDYISIVNFPNLPEAACGFTAKGLANGYAVFPPLINDYVKQPEAGPVTKFSLGSDTAICFGEHKLAAPEGWESYVWNTGDSTREITVTRPGNYQVLAGPTGFSAPSAYGYINISRAGSPLNIGRDTTVCPKSSYTIHVPDNYNNVVWSDGSTAQDKTVTIGGSYRVKASDQNGCANWDTIYVGFRYYPRAEFGKDTTLCVDQSLQLTLQPAANPWSEPARYIWQDGWVGDYYTVTSPGTYWAEVSYQGCTVSDTIVVRYFNSDSVQLGSDTTLYIGDSLLIYTNVLNGKYLWSTGDTTHSISIKNSGSYWLEVNNGSCTARDTININFEPKPPFIVKTICPNGSTVLATPVYQNEFTYQWQVDSGTGYINVTDNSIHSGSATSSLSLNNAPTSLAGFLYRCVVSNSNEAIFTMPLKLAFSSKWNGGVSNSWSNPMNWDCGVTPDANTDVIINSSVPVLPTITSNVSVKSLAVQPGASVKVGAGFKLNVTGNSK